MEFALKNMHDYRAPISVADFDAIPIYPDDPLGQYHEVLIDGNARIIQFWNEFGKFPELNFGQKLLHQIGGFDAQVKNGGISQFFWNCREDIIDVADGIAFLREAKLLALYERAVEDLLGKRERWHALRQTWNSGSDVPQWKAFQDSYKLLDLGWFDDAYLDHWGENARGEWAEQSRGLHYSLLERLADYIRANRDQFIVERSTT
jgi:hypothetical protein